jgi:hypothetical protein
MSTPSPQPLDYDLVSPYAPKHARDPVSPPAADPVLASRPRPGAIETEHDAKILDEIEASLRAMIDAEHSAPPQPEAQPQEAAPEENPVVEEADTAAPDEPMPPTIDALETPSLAEDTRTPEHRYIDALRVQEVMQQVAQQLASRNAQDPIPVQPQFATGPEPIPSVPSAQPHAPTQLPQFVPETEQEAEEPMRLYRLPPAFLARSMEPIRLDDPQDESWPKGRSKARSKQRNSASTLFVRFGFAAGGAAVVMMFALPDLRARFFDTVGTPLAAMTNNAAAVFGEGKPQPQRSEPIAAVAVRTEPVVLARETERIVAPVQQPTPVVAIPSPAPEPRFSARSDKAPVATPESPPRRETVMTPIAPPPSAAQEAQNPNIWHGPPGRADSEPRTNGVAARSLAPEEIELLRKMGKDFIAAGDLAGARGVLERAADAGDASSALALAATYDAEALARFKVKGMVPDNAKAAFWYERARDLGSQEAPARLKALARSN